MTEFDKLFKCCGLSIGGAAMLLDVRQDTVRKWKSGRSDVPDGVLESMKSYADAAGRIF